MDSAEIDLFAGSPFITEIYRRVREEYIVHLCNQGHDKLVNEWLDATKFKLDSLEGQAIAKRIQNRPEHIVRNVAGFDRQQITNLARGFVEPLPVDDREIESLANLITERVKE